MEHLRPDQFEPIPVIVIIVRVACQGAMLGEDVFSPLLAMPSIRRPTMGLAVIHPNPKFSFRAPYGNLQRNREALESFGIVADRAIIKSGAGRSGVEFYLNRQQALAPVLGKSIFGLHSWPANSKSNGAARLV